MFLSNCVPPTLYERAEYVQYSVLRVSVCVKDVILEALMCYNNYYNHLCDHLCNVSVSPLPQTNEVSFSLQKRRGVLWGGGHLQLLFM